jgi:very-short-patch-repair endonuclease
MYLYHRFLTYKDNHLVFPNNILKGWKSEIRSSLKGNDTISNSEKSLGNILADMKLPFEGSVFNRDILSVVDFYAPDSKTVLQYDGPSHFLSDGSFNGSTLFQTRLLEYRGYDIARIDYKYWARKKVWEKKKHLKALLKIKE